jgi:membrane-bound hydrogenase subunit beta
MPEETSIQQSLIAKFPYLQDKITNPRERRMFAEVSQDKFAEVFDHLFKRMGFTILCSMTGLDLGTSIGVIYHMANEKGVILNLCTSVPKDAPVLQTVTSAFPAADAYEREIMDLLGATVQGLPPGNRYPLPDGWPEGVYPLRKDCDPKAFLK